MPQQDLRCVLPVLPSAPELHHRRLDKDHHPSTTKTTFSSRHSTLDETARRQKRPKIAFFQAFTRQGDCYRANLKGFPWKGPSDFAGEKGEKQRELAGGRRGHGNPR